MCNYKTIFLGMVQFLVRNTATDQLDSSRLSRFDGTPILSTKRLQRPDPQQDSGKSPQLAERSSISGRTRSL